VIEARTEVGAQASSLAPLQSFLETFWSAAGLEPAERFPFELALEEVFMNVVMHGSEGLTGVQFAASLTVEAHTVIMQLRDNSNPFDPLQAPPPDIEAQIEDRQVGGLGIYLTRTLMDDVQYEFKDGSNVLTLTKRLAG
jgi:anti-sigma regulatory factor (Ser/Thr protein kinase)